MHSLGSGMVDCVKVFVGQLTFIDGICDVLPRQRASRGKIFLGMVCNENIGILFQFYLFPSMGLCEVSVMWSGADKTIAQHTSTDSTKDWRAGTFREIQNLSPLKRVPSD